MSSKIPMVGNLVEFYSSVDSFMSEYRDRNPGIVVASKKRAGVSGYKDSGRTSAYILWSNGEITREHSTYVRVIEKEFN